jgi:hypothetical protein
LIVMYVVFVVCGLCVEQPNVLDELMHWQPTTGQFGSAQDSV